MSEDRPSPLADENQRFVRWNLDGYCDAMNRARRDRVETPLIPAGAPNLARQPRRSMERKMAKVVG